MFLDDCDCKYEYADIFTSQYVDKNEKMNGGYEMKKGIGLLLAMGMAATLSVSANAADTVRVAIWDNNQLSGLQQIADEWSTESGYDVEFQVLDWGTYWTMLEAGVSGGDMPDVFWMHSDYAQMYSGANVLLDLNSYIENDDTINLDNYYSGITEIYSKDGVQYAIPKDHDTIAVVYNKAVFDKYGVEYPTNDWTWEEFAQIAQEITEKGKDDGVYGTYMNCGSNEAGWYNIIYSFGGGIISDDKKQSLMDNEETIKAMQFVHDEILPACPSQDSMANTAGDTMVVSGTIGIYPDGSWMVNSYYSADNKDDFAWVEIPWHDQNRNGQCDEGERVSVYNGLGWSIYSGSEQADAAWSLISAFTCEEGQIKQSELGVTMAGYIGCSEAFMNAFEGMDISAFTDVEESGTLVFRPYSKYTGRWKDNFTQLLIPAWNDEMTMEEALLLIADDMNSLLASE